MISKEERAKLYNTVFKADNEFDDVSLDMICMKTFMKNT